MVVPLGAGVTAAPNRSGAGLVGPAVASLFPHRLPLATAFGELRSQVRAYAALGLSAGHRRDAVLRSLGACGAGAPTEAGAAATCLQVLATDPADLPFVALYQVDRSGPTARLVGSSGRLGSVRPPAALPLDTMPAATRWPVDLAWTTGEVVEIADAPEVGRLLVLPVGPAVPREADAMLVAGTALRLPLDEAYGKFLDAVAASVGVVLATGRAADRERDRVEAVAALDRLRAGYGASVADELGTPLAVLAGLLRRALDAPPDEPLDAVALSGLTSGWDMLEHLGRRMRALREPDGPQLGLLDTRSGSAVHTAPADAHAAEAPQVLVAVHDREDRSAGVGGLQLVRVLHAEPRTEELPVVLLSMDLPGAAAAGLAAGADDHLVRPFDPVELLARLRARLDAAEHRRRERARHDEAESNLRIALATRERVGIAVGLVMAQRSCSADDAFAVLRDASQRTNVKLAEVARQVVAAANPPGRGV